MDDENDQVGHLSSEEESGYEGAVGNSNPPGEGENLDDVYAQLAQKDRNLVLAAELGKALLDSNQELQSRYDQLLEDYNSKVEGLQQEKYILHLDLEKLETEQQNRVKDLQDDISVLRGQLLETSQYKQATESETSRCLLEAQQKSEYLADQIQQAGRREEDLFEKLHEEVEKNSSSQLVIQDHLDHIAMLREQVEYLTDKLKEADEEKACLIQREATLVKQLQSLKPVLKQGKQVKQRTERVDDCQPHLPGREDSHLPSAPAQIHPGGTVETTQTMVSGIEGFSGYHSTSLFKPVEIPCRTGELSPSNRASQSPTSTLESAASSVRNRSPVPSSSNLMLEFSTPFRHMRNRSDCSVSSTTEGSRKRHYHNIALSSDEDEDMDTPQRTIKTAYCKQSLLSKLIDSSNAQKSNHLTKSHSMSNNNGGDNDGSFSLVSDSIPDRSKESDNSSSSQGPSLSEGRRSSVTYARSFTDPGKSSSVEHTWSNPNIHSNAPRRERFSRQREMSLFDELSSHDVEFDRQNSGNSEKSLFDELSTHLQEEDDSEESGDYQSSSCLRGHPDFYNRSDWFESRDDHHKLNSQHGDLKQYDSDSNYTCEWPLLSSVSADMLEDDDDEEDDFECDDDDFLVGNNAGSTLSIGDSGVGPMLKSYHSSLDAEPLDTSDPWHSAEGKRWNEKIKEDHKNKQALDEACQQLRELVVRLSAQKGEPVATDEEFYDTDFDQLLSLVQQLRLCVDQLDEGELLMGRKGKQEQESLEGSGSDDCRLFGESKRGWVDSVASGDQRQSISSSSLLVRRSL